MRYNENYIGEHKDEIISAFKISKNKSVIEFSSRINKAPCKKIRINGYNNYTPQGQCYVKNQSYSKELTVWKNKKLTPYFLSIGFSKKEITEAFKEFKNGQ
jgi:hypothetical protein